MPSTRHTRANSQLEPDRRIAGADLGAWLPLAQDWTRHAGAYHLAVQRAWWSFVALRLKKDAALLEHLSTCDHVVDVTHAYGAFVAEAMEDYRTEAAKLARIGTDFAATASGLTQLSGEGRTGHALPEADNAAGQSSSGDAMTTRLDTPSHPSRLRA